jgi:IMP cyclohydrolase
MQSDLTEISSREYPGRIIIIGLDSRGENVVICYAVTGRSPSSQARKLVQKKDSIWTVPTDDSLLGREDENLLLYPCMICLPIGIAVSNGKQTEDISAHIGKTQSPKEVLASALCAWDYEPDAPSFTPRISGCVLSQEIAALSVIRKAADSRPFRHYYEFPLKPGKGKMVMTYTGKNRDPLPSFIEEPLDVGVLGCSAEEMAESVYEALGPQKNHKDFRVAVACVFVWDFASLDHDLFLINRQERKGES